MATVHAPGVMYHRVLVSLLDKRNSRMLTSIQTICSFIIVTSTPKLVNHKALLKALNFAEFTESPTTARLSDIPKLDYETDPLLTSTYIGRSGDNLIIKENNWVCIPEIYWETICTFFPGSKIISVDYSYREIDGVGLEIRKDNVTQIKIRAYGQNDILYDLKGHYITEDAQNDGNNIELGYARILIQKILFSETNIENFNSIELNLFRQTPFKSLGAFDDYYHVISNHFPTLSDDLVQPAYVARFDRSELEQEYKELKYPTSSELINRFLKIYEELLGQGNFRITRSQNLLKRKTKDFETKIMFSGSKGYLDLSISKRFLFLESMLKRIFKSHDLGIFEKKLVVYVRMQDFFRSEIDYNSYESLATQLYWRTKYFFERILPHFQSLEDLNYLNRFINHGDHTNNCFSGNRVRRKKPLFENAIIAYKVKDQNADQILEKDVLPYVNDPFLRTKIEDVFRNYDT